MARPVIRITAGRGTLDGQEGRMGRILLLWVLAFLAQAAEAAGSTVREQYYTVYGQTVADIQRSIFERTPMRNARGAFAGNTKSNFRTTYRLIALPQQGCTVANAVVKVESVVTLPQLAPAVRSPAVETEWRRYYAALRAHEYLHVQNGEESARTAQQWLAGVKTRWSCAEAKPQVSAAIRSFLLRLDERDQQMDAATEHGRSQGAWLDARVR